MAVCAAVCASSLPRGLTLLFIPSSAETGCVRCIRCAQYGHVNCGADDKVWRPGSRSADYCYKCGGNTHLAQRCSLAFAEQGTCLMWPSRCISAYDCGSINAYGCC